MSYYYKVPTEDKSISSVRGSVLAVGVALLFLYLVNFIFQILITYVIDRQEKELLKIKTRLLQASRSLYLYIIASIFSVYPPFYYGPHCGLFAWITLIFGILLHIFCVVQKTCNKRSVYSYMYFLYHLSISIWIIITLIVGFTWSNKQEAAWDQV